PRQLAEFITALLGVFPGKRWVLSCAPTDRERKKMDELLSLLPQKPWRVFVGELNLTQLAAVIRHAAVHCCGDTGTLHLALMTGTPAVSWFWPNPGRQIWLPVGDRYHTIVGTNEAGSKHLGKVQTGELVRAVQSVLVAAVTPQT